LVMLNRAMAASLALALGGAALPSLAVAQEMPAAGADDPLRTADATADAVAEQSPDTVTQMANWVAATGDNGGLPFMVIDKIAAQVFLFDAEGLFLGATPALLGVTPGDDSAPGVGDRELSEIKPEDRTTPAGRFVAKFGPASGNRNVLWVDYATSISLHAVVTGNKKERRLQRLRSPSPEDNRITYGCINVPARFYQDIVRPLLGKATAVVYILPETKPLTDVFPMFRIQAQSTVQSGL
jgi:hypothetical protein